MRERGISRFTGDVAEGDAAFERELERLLGLRDKAIAAHSGFQVQQAEALLEAHLPNWKEFVEAG